MATKFQSNDDHVGLSIGNLQFRNVCINESAFGTHRIRHNRFCRFNFSFPFGDVKGKGFAPFIHWMLS